MERLTAFEFIAADATRPTIVRLIRRPGTPGGADVVLNEYGFQGWFGMTILDEWFFEQREQLAIEGQGIGRPYWNGEATPWDHGFDPDAEARRIALIRGAVQREVNRAALSLS